MNETSREELVSYMKQYGVDYTTGNVTPTLCALVGIEPPDVCGGFTVPQVVDQAYHLFGDDGKCQKALVFCPDAVGDVHLQRRPEIVGRIKKATDFMFKGTTVMASVTPVCFATIFSGASPQVHGIKEYMKPVLEIQTLFDVMALAGKNVAIVSVNGCSIDMIFRKRRVDYYSLRTDEAVHQLTLKLIEEDYYDLIISYQTDYDHYSHLYGPWSDEAIGQLELSAKYTENLVAATDKHWAKYNRAFLVTPDHGNHEISPENTKGSHGMNIADDMVVNHFYRLRPAQ